MPSLHLRVTERNGLTDVFSSCYSHALTIITDSEEKRHGGTSQEVSQEVRREEREQANRRKATRESRGVGKALREKGATGKARRRVEKVFCEAPGDQEARGKTSGDQEECSQKRRREA